MQNSDVKQTQVTQPVKYGNNYANLNAFVANQIDMHLCIPIKNWAVQVLFRVVRCTWPQWFQVLCIVAYPHSHSHSESYQSHLFPSTHGQLAHTVVVQSGSESPASYNVAASDVVASLVLLYIFATILWWCLGKDTVAWSSTTTAESGAMPIPFCVMVSQDIQRRMAEGRTTDDGLLRFASHPNNIVHNSSPYHINMLTSVTTSLSHPGSAICKSWSFCVRVLYPRCNRSTSSPLWSITCGHQKKMPEPSKCEFTKSYNCVSIERCQLDNYNECKAA